MPRHSPRSQVSNGTPNTKDCASGLRTYSVASSVFSPSALAPRRLAAAGQALRCEMTLGREVMACCSMATADDTCTRNTTSTSASTSK